MLLCCNFLLETEQGLCWRCTHPFTLKQKVPRESLAKMHRTVQNPVFCSKLLRNKNECEN